MKTVTLGKVFLDKDSQDRYRPNFENRFELNTIAYSDNKSRPNNCIAEILVNGVPLNLVVDTSAVVSVLPGFVFIDKFLEFTPKLKRSKMSLETYTGKNINVLGELQARVNTKDGQQKFIPIVSIQSESRNQPLLWEATGWRPLN